MGIKLSWPKKILLYSIVLTSVAVLLTSFITVRTAAHIWEKEFTERNVAYARYTSLDVLRIFGGSFTGEVLPELTEAMEFLRGYNQDLVGIMILTESGRILFSTVAPEINRSLERERGDGLAEAVQEVILSDEPDVREIGTGSSRLQDVIAPVSTRGSSRPIAVRYVYSYASLEQRAKDHIRAAIAAALALLLIGGLLSIVLSRGLVRPVRVLSTGAARIAGGDREHRIDVETGDEMEHLALQFNRMVDSLSTQQEELEAANLELREANARLRELQAQLVRSERLAALGQLSAGVSHELDNPVGVILGYAELIRDESGEKTIDEYAAIILEEAKRCKRIIAGLLDFSRPSTGQREVLDMRVLVEDLVDQLRDQRAFRDVRWELVPGDGEPVVCADPDDLRQIFVNLGLNSVHAMSGSGVITVEIAEHLHGDRRGFLVRFADTGPGLTEEIVERVFDPFFTTKRKGEGTGLGLSICRKLVEEADGWLRAVAGPVGIFEMWLPGG
ncbi:MAG: HAMP domain-containing protein [bacterium]|nr:MAG: HAMP domain-containing protein [bacterium]